jgi:hypothetical protein
MRKNIKTCERYQVTNEQEDREKEGKSADYAALFSDS